MARTGRPSKLTQETHDRIISAVRAGNYMETAAAYGGVHKNSLYEWLKRGRDPKEKKPEYRAFAEAMDEALAEAEVRDVALIAKAAEEHWQAAAWRLERKFPARWGKKDRHELTGLEGKEIVVHLDLNTPPPRPD